jgi:hypothetical protein
VKFADNRLIRGPDSGAILHDARKGAEKWCNRGNPERVSGVQSVGLREASRKPRFEHLTDLSG